MAWGGGPQKGLPKVGWDKPPSREGASLGLVRGDSSVTVGEKRGLIFDSEGSEGRSGELQTSRPFLS